MGLRDRYPKLANLLGAYFNQDWKYGYFWGEHEPHYAPVVRFYKTNNPPASVGQAARELKEFLALDFDEEKLEDALYHQLGLGVMPSYWELTFRGWLEEVLKILEEPPEQTKKQFIPPFR